VLLLEVLLLVVLLLLVLLVVLLVLVLLLLLPPLPPRPAACRGAVHLRARAGMFVRKPLHRPSCLPPPCRHPVAVAVAPATAHVRAHEGRARTPPMHACMYDCMPASIPHLLAREGCSWRGIGHGVPLRRELLLCEQLGPRAEVGQHGRAARSQRWQPLELKPC